jgi:tRNA threonylcarbamoyladenosine biosynthesis protein TsaB
MITLAIETSTTSGGVALLHDGELLFHERFLADRSHSSQLFTVLQRLPRLDFDQIAVGLGPGSYAGVRIGISAAIGLLAGQEGEMAGIPSVAAYDGAKHYQAVGDARRGAFYFAEVEEGICLEGPKLLTLEELQARLNPALPVFASEKISALPQLEFCLPSAEIIARMAQSNRGIYSKDNLEPIYLRDPYITQPKNKPVFR